MIETLFLNWNLEWCDDSVTWDQDCVFKLEFREWCVDSVTWDRGFIFKLELRMVWRFSDLKLRLCF